MKPKTFKNMAPKAKPEAEKIEKSATQKSTAKVATAPKVEKEAPKKAASKSKTYTEEDIRQRAYEIFLETGNHNEHENWVQAEKEFLKKK